MLCSSAAQRRPLSVYYDQLKFFLGLMSSMNFLLQFPESILHGPDGFHENFCTLKGAAPFKAFERQHIQYSKSAKSPDRWLCQSSQHVFFSSVHLLAWD
jgi:hypothetical protein